MTFLIFLKPKAQLFLYFSKNTGNIKILIIVKQKCFLWKYSTNSSFQTIYLSFLCSSFSEITNKLGRGLRNSPATTIKTIHSPLTIQQLHFHDLDKYTSFIINNPSVRLEKGYKQVVKAVCLSFFPQDNDTFGQRKSIPSPCKIYIWPTCTFNDDENSVAF